MHACTGSEASVYTALQRAETAGREGGVRVEQPGSQVRLGGEGFGGLE